MSGNSKPSGPVVLTEEEAIQLYEHLRAMRHDVNGRMANIVAAAELIRLRPEFAAQRLAILVEQPHKAAEAINQFTRLFEQAFDVKRK